MREAALIAINILRNLDHNNQKYDDLNDSQFKSEPPLKSYEITPSLKEIYEKYKNPDISQNRMSVGKSSNNPQNIYKKYLSENKKAENNSIRNSPSNYYYDSNKFNSNQNNNNNVNTIINGNNQKANNFGNDCAEEPKSNSKDLIAQHDLEYLFSKMEIIMIQQNKIYENFINFESTIKNEINDIKQKIVNIESKVFGPPDYQPYHSQPIRTNNFLYKLPKNEEIRKSGIQNKSSLLGLYFHFK